MILDEETNREGGRGERGGVEHPGEPAARYARRGTPLLSSLLYTLFPLPPPYSPFLSAPFPVILSSNLDPFAHLSLRSSLAPRFQGSATLNNVPRTRLCLPSLPPSLSLYIYTRTYRYSVTSGYYAGAAASLNFALKRGIPMRRHGRHEKLVRIGF